MNQYQHQTQTQINSNTAFPPLSVPFHPSSRSSSLFSLHSRARSRTRQLRKFPLSVIRKQSFPACKIHQSTNFPPIIQQPATAAAGPLRHCQSDSFRAALLPIGNGIAPHAEAAADDDRTADQIQRNNKKRKRSQKQNQIQRQLQDDNAEAAKLYNSKSSNQTQYHSHSHSPSHGLTHSASLSHSETRHGAHFDSSSHSALPARQSLGHTVSESVSVSVSDWQRRRQRNIESAIKLIQSKKRIGENENFEHKQNENANSEHGRGDDQTEKKADNRVIPVSTGFRHSFSIFHENDDQRRAALHYRIGDSEPFERCFKQFCSEFRLQTDRTKFMWRDQTIKAANKPSQLRWNASTNDYRNCNTQTDDGDDEAAAAADEEYNGDWLIKCVAVVNYCIRWKDDDERAEAEFHWLRPSDRFQSHLVEWAARVGLAVDDLIFYRNRRRIRGHQTPLEIGLKNNQEIIASMEEEELEE